MKEFSRAKGVAVDCGDQLHDLLWNGFALSSDLTSINGICTLWGSTSTFNSLLKSTALIHPSNLSKLCVQLEKWQNVIILELSVPSRLFHFPRLSILNPCWCHATLAKVSKYSSGSLDTRLENAYYICRFAIV